MKRYLIRSLKCAVHALIVGFIVGSIVLLILENIFELDLEGLNLLEIVWYIMTEDAEFAFYLIIGFTLFTLIYPFFQFGEEELTFNASKRVDDVEYVMGMRGFKRAESWSRGNDDMIFVASSISKRLLRMYRDRIKITTVDGISSIDGFDNDVKRLKHLLNSDKRPILPMKSNYDHARKYFRLVIKIGVCVTIIYFIFPATLIMCLSAGTDMTVEIFGKLFLDDNKFVLYGLIGIWVVLAIAAPGMFSSKHDLSFNASEHVRDIERIMAIEGYKRIKSEIRGSDDMLFVKSSSLGRLLCIYEDGVEITTIDGISSIGGGDIASLFHGWNLMSSRHVDRIEELAKTFEDYIPHTSKR